MVAQVKTRQVRHEETDLEKLTWTLLCCLDHIERQGQLYIFIIIKQFVSTRTMYNIFSPFGNFKGIKI